MARKHGWQLPAHTLQVHSLILPLRRPPPLLIFWIASLLCLGVIRAGLSSNEQNPL